MVPGLLGLMGGTSVGLALAPALRTLSWPFLAVTILLLGRGWILELSHGSGWRSPWSRRARLTLMASTGLATLIWGLRFVGLLGMGLV